MCLERINCRSFRVMRLANGKNMTKYSSEVLCYKTHDTFADLNRRHSLRISSGRKKFHTDSILHSTTRTRSDYNDPFFFFFFFYLFVFRKASKICGLIKKYRECCDKKKTTIHINSAFRKRIREQERKKKETKTSTRKRKY